MFFLFGRSIGSSSAIFFVLVLLKSAVESPWIIAPVFLCKSDVQLDSVSRVTLLHKDLCK